MLTKSTRVKLLVLAILCSLVHLYFFMKVQDLSGWKILNINHTVHNPHHKKVALSQYIEKYESLVNLNCSQKYGNQMFLAWQKNQKELCHGRSHIVCLKREPYSVPRYLCGIDDAEIRMLQPFYKADHDDLSLQSNIIMKEGLVKADCDSTKYKTIPKTEWVKTVKNFLGELSIEKNLECTHYINVTVFWLHRRDATNVYHAMEDFITTFESLAVMNIDPSDVEIAVYDGFVMTNANSQLWSLLFGHGVRVIRRDPYPVGTCFRKSIINMHGGISHLSNNGMVGKNNKCASPIMMGMRDWILQTLDIEDRRMPQDLHSDKEYKVAFVSRARKIGKDNFFTRIMDNEAKLLDYVRSQLPRNWKLMIFRPETFESIKEQIRYVLSSDILVGAHGAALSYSMYLPKHAHVIEIFMGNRGPENRHYHNMCKWLGLSYHSPSYQRQEVNIIQIWSLIDKSIKSIMK